MKKIIFIAAIVAACGPIHAAQDTSLTERELRDPKQLKPWLEANASDAQTRLTALEGSTSVTASVIGDFTVASNLTVNGTAVITGTVSVNALDGVGAVDIDYGSADITDHTFTSDGGTVVLDGTIVASDDITCDKIIFTDAATAAPTNAASAGFLITVNGTNYWIALYPAND